MHEAIPPIPSTPSWCGAQLKKYRDNFTFTFRYMAWNRRECGRKWSKPTIRPYPSVCLEELKKTTNIFTQIRQSPGQGMKQKRKELGHYFHSTWICEERVQPGGGTECVIIQTYLLTSIYHWVSI